MKNFQENWFEEWFDSKYYHMLYAHRDYNEAEAFIGNLMKYLEQKKSNTILDLACGKGRHAIHLHKLGFEVLGIDLSKESIEEAKQYETPRLKFKQGDMRSLNLNSEVNLVLNLFTSFGYFKSQEEDQKAINSISEALKPDGTLVIDYLNVFKTEKSLPNEEVILRENVEFNISKSMIQGFIIKDIKFLSEGKLYHFKEFVKSLKLKDFSHYLENAGFRIRDVFGSYQLEKFDKLNSDRLIIVADKKP